MSDPNPVFNGRMPLDPLLVEVLACPDDKGPLVYVEGEEVLLNPRLRRLYRIESGIPVMLVDESEIVSVGESERLLAKASQSSGRTQGGN